MSVRDPTLHFIATPPACSFRDSRILVFDKAPQRVSQFSSTHFEQLRPAPAICSTTTSTSFDPFCDLLTSSSWTIVADKIDYLVWLAIAATFWWFLHNHNTINHCKRQTRNLRVNLSGFLSGEFGFRVGRDMLYKFTCRWRIWLQFLFDSALTLSRAG